MTIIRTDRLDPGDVADVLAMLREVAGVDGVEPLSEHVVLHLRHGGEAPAVHLRAVADGALIGYAHVDTTDAVAGAAAELAVRPAARNHGIGRALAIAAMTVADQRSGGRLRLWAHGDHPAASALARSLGFNRARVLYQLRRSLAEPLPEPVLAPGVRVRSFRVGADDAAWLAVNAAAFADHPEQGSWTLADLRVRQLEPWFDPAGFLIAESASGDMLGFHWTKVHGSQPHVHAPIGEVYVLGVAPAAHGTGLGRALTLAGLRYLRSRALDQAMLYVDESNTVAVALYHKLGFTTWITDVSYSREAVH